MVWRCKYVQCLFLKLMGKGWSLNETTGTDVSKDTKDTRGENLA